MSVGEVKRRLMGPESFNFSLLGALLRRAKMPEKSQMLMEELKQVGLEIPRGRRRNTHVTLLSALTESESVQFARDFQRLSNTEFPCKQLAELAVKRKTRESSNSTSAMRKGNFSEKRNEILIKRMEHLKATLKMAVEFQELLSEDRSPVMDSVSCVENLKSMSRFFLFFSESRTDL